MSFCFGFEFVCVQRATKNGTLVSIDFVCAPSHAVCGFIVSFLETAGKL
jgi:hypothetical protein